MRTIVCAPEADDKKLAAFAARSFGEDAEIIADSSFSRAAKKKAAGAFVYFDARIGVERAMELASKLEGVEDCGWGVIDREGSVEDPAALFFAGASDYVGPALFKEGMGPERAEEALTFAGLASERTEAEDSAEDCFPGWASIEEGKDVRVRFCYAAVADQKGLVERIGDKRLQKLKEDFAAFLDPWARECGGIVWIKEHSGCLLLFPPQDEGMNPVLAAFRLLLDRALIGYEVFKLEVPLSFRFAFHAGRAQWRKPGETGSVVSEDVNFVFHLGMKAAGDGYILISGEAEKSVPPYLRDLFASSGDFEGRSLIASRKFKE